MASNRTNRRHQDSRIAWFAELERARRSGDAEAIRRATSELRALGVGVVFIEKGDSGAGRGGR